MGAGGSSPKRQGISTPLIDHAGVLVLGGSMFWSAKHFVLFQDGALDWYASEDAFRGGKLPQGQVDLFGGAVLFVREPKVSAAVAAKACLEINTTHRTIYVYSDDGAEAIEAWARKLNAAAIRSSSAPAARAARRRQSAPTASGGAAAAAAAGATRPAAARSKADEARAFIVEAQRREEAAES